MALNVSEQKYGVAAQVHTCNDVARIPRIPRDAMYGVLDFKHVQAAAGRNFPNANSSVISAGYHVFTVWRERDGADEGRMPTVSDGMRCWIRTQLFRVGQPVNNGGVQTVKLCWFGGAQMPWCGVRTLGSRTPGQC